MTTEKQIKANQANAQLGTGPTTEKGKRTSSMNAVTHGLTAKYPLLPGDDPAEFEELLQTLQREFMPIGLYDRLWIAQLAGLFWRSARFPHLEVGILTYARSEIQRGIARRRSNKAELREAGLDNPLNLPAPSETCQNLIDEADAAETVVNQAEDSWGGAYLHDVKNGDALSKLGRHEVRIRNAIDKLIAHLDERRARHTMYRPFDESERRAYGLDEPEAQEPI
jgi:hypothetical protein